MAHGDAAFVPPSAPPSPSRFLLYLAVCPLLHMAPTCRRVLVKGHMTTSSFTLPGIVMYSSPCAFQGFLLCLSIVVPCAFEAAAVCFLTVRRLYGFLLCLSIVVPVASVTIHTPDGQCACRPIVQASTDHQINNH
jgi:hypothetical protein